MHGRADKGGECPFFSLVSFRARSNTVFRLRKAKVLLAFFVMISAFRGFQESCQFSSHLILKTTNVLLDEDGFIRGGDFLVCT